MIGRLWAVALNTFREAFGFSGTPLKLMFRGREKMKKS